jgi:hypothetical protein
MTIFVPLLILVAAEVSFGQTDRKHEQPAKEPPTRFVGRADSFLGIRFGKPLGASVSSCEDKRSDLLQCYVPTALPSSIEGQHFYEVKRREGSSCMVAEGYAGVEQVSITIGANQVDQYREALVKKYGQVSQISDKIIGNGIGATFDAITYRWDVGTFRVLLEGPDLTDGKYGSITAYRGAKVARIRPGHNEAVVQKKVDQF